MGPIRRLGIERMNLQTSAVRPMLRWAALGALSIAVAYGLELVRLPAAFLLGPLIAGIAVRLAGLELHVPRPAYLSAQAVVGTMIGAVLTPAILATFLADWPILLASVAAVIALTTLAGWVLSRAGVVPGTTAVWGSSPGAATAMVVMAEAYGADVRLVAFMQYLRVVFVATAASGVARLWIGSTGATPLPTLFPPVPTTVLATTLAIVGIGGAVGHFSRIPSGAMLVPLVATAALHGSGLVDVVLPTWLLIAAYAAIGWTIGLGFTRASLAHAWRALPWIVLSIVVLMAFAGGIALALVELLGIDPLTAYLATSPGGLDTVAIIAASTPVDVSFVMALQAMRFLVLILVGPALARAVAARVRRP